MSPPSAEAAATTTEPSTNGAATTTTTTENDKNVLVLNVAVGSTNPVKIDAVKKALEQILQQSIPRRQQEKSNYTKIDLQIHSYNVPSDVPNQPFGDEETQRGAKNRAENAYDAYRKEQIPHRRPDLAIGIEGGLEWSQTILDVQGKPTLWCMAWMAIIGKRSHRLAEALASSDATFYAADLRPICGFGKTSTFLLPSKLSKLIVEQNMELGDADDKLFGRTNSKQNLGSVGLLTDGIISRTDYYQPAITLALVPWIRPDIYVASSNESTTTTTTTTTSATTTTTKDPTDGGEEDDDEEESSSSGSNFFGSLFCFKRTPTTKR